MSGEAEPDLRGILQGLITYLGLSQREAASIVGIGKDAISRKLVGHERYPARESDVAPLRRLAATIDGAVASHVATIKDFVAAAPPPHERPTHANDYGRARDRVGLVVYQKDEDLPPWAGMPFASLHRMMMVRISREAEKEGVEARLVAYDRQHYRTWLAGRPDTEESRSTWAFEMVRPTDMGLDVGKDHLGWAVLRPPVVGAIAVPAKTR